MSIRPKRAELQEEGKGQRDRREDAGAGRDVEEPGPRHDSVFGKAEGRRHAEEQSDEGRAAAAIRLLTQVARKAAGERYGVVRERRLTGSIVVGVLKISAGGLQRGREDPDERDEKDDGDDDEERPAARSRGRPRLSAAPLMRRAALSEARRWRRATRWR